MAPISYYYLISLALFSGILLWLINLFYLRFRGRTTFGQVYKKGSPEHTKIMSLANKKNFIVSATIGLILLANLTLSVILTLNKGNSDKYILLFSAPIAVVILLGVGVISQRNRFGVDSTNHESSHITSKKNGSDDSWLS